jgi:hypothetical protein
VLAELVEGHEVAALMLSNKFIQIRINLYVILVQLLLEFLSRDTAHRVVLQGGTQLLLVGVHTLTRGARHLHSLGSVEVLIVGLHWRGISGVLFQIGIVVEGMGNLGVLDLADLLSSNVIYEFRCRLNSDLCLNLLNKSVSINLAGVKSFENIIQ